MRKQYKHLSEFEKFDLRKYREAGATIEELTLLCGASAASVQRALAEMREKFGPEQFRDPRHNARARFARSLRESGIKNQP